MSGILITCPRHPDTYTSFKSHSGHTKKESSSVVTTSQSNKERKLTGTPSRSSLGFEEVSGFEEASGLESAHSTGLNEATATDSGSLGDTHP